MVGGVAGRGDGAQPAVLLAVARAGSTLAPRAAPAPVGMVAVAVGEQDEPDPAPLLAGSRTASRWPASSGPGSITTQGSDPYR